MSTEDAFRAALLSPEAPVPPGLTDGAGRPARRRYAVYRNNVAVGLGEALQTAFPAVANLLGTTNFRAIAALYLRQAPPDSPVLHRYGAGFAAFLAGLPALASRPWLADVARLDQALRQAYHAADAQPIAAEALAALPPADLPAQRLYLAPAVQVIDTPYPLHDIWRRAMGSADAIGAAAQWVLVSRPGHDPQADPLDAAQGHLARALLAGQPLGPAVEAAETDPAPLLALLLARGALIRTETLP